MQKTTHHFARRVNDLSESAIFRIGARAKALARDGHDIVRLDAGEPDFNTPKGIIEAAKQALDDGFTRYTEIGGLPQLKDAIQRKLEIENHLHYSHEQIMHTCGAKQGLFNACLSLLGPGDEIVIPTPHWGTYPAIADIAAAKIVNVTTHYEDGFVLKPEELESVLTERSRVLILNSPNNPTGQVYSRDDLAALGNVLLKYPNVVVLSDDIYEHLRFSDAPYANIVNVCPSLKNRTVVINGVSKAYAMTGWRVGFAAGPEDIIKEMQKLQGQTNSHTAAVSQVAAAAALNGGLDEVGKMTQVFADRARQVANGLAKIDQIKCLPAQGSFYCLPDFSPVIESLSDVNDDRVLADWLLDELGIAMIPGSAFNAPGHMRLSFAANDQSIQKGLVRLKQAFA